MMRLLSLLMAAAFTVGSISMVQACPAMKNASSQEKQVVAAEKAPKAPSTPIVIPKKVKSEG